MDAGCHRGTQATTHVDKTGLIGTKLETQRAASAVNRPPIPPSAPFAVRNSPGCPSRDQQLVQLGGERE